MAEYDCVVIGSGPGGYVAAIRAAQLGMKTAVVEKDKVGGRCLNYACIPAKAMLRVAEVYSEALHGEQFGVKAKGVEIDFKGATAHRDKVIETLTGGVGGLFKKNKIDLIEGHGSLTDDGNVVVGGSFDGNEIEAGKVVLATGSVSKPLLGLEFGDRVLDTAATHTPTGVSRSRPARAARRLTQSTSRHVPLSCSIGITNPHTSIEPGISSGASQITNGAATTTIPNPTLACTIAPTSTAVPSTSTRPSVGSGTATT